MDYLLKTTHQSLKTLRLMKAQKFRDVSHFLVYPDRQPKKIANAAEALLRETAQVSLVAKFEIYLTVIVNKVERILVSAVGRAAKP